MAVDPAGCPGLVLCLRRLSLAEIGFRVRVARLLMLGIAVLIFLLRRGAVLVEADSSSPCCLQMGTTQGCSASLAMIWTQTPAPIVGSGYRAARIGERVLILLASLLFKVVP